MFTRTLRPAVCLAAAVAVAVLAAPRTARADPPKIGASGRIDGRGGLRIASIRPGGLAATSLRVGDRIIGVNGSFVNSRDDVARINRGLANLQDGDVVDVVFERNGIFHDARNRWQADTVSFGLLYVRPRRR